MSAGHQWTPESTAYIAQNYRSKSVDEIAAILGRSAVSVRTKAHRLGLSCTQNVSQRYSRSANPFGLSDQEIRVLRSLAEGRSIEGVAAHLSASPSTIGDRLKSIRRRMGVYCSTRMVLKAERAGLLAGVEV